MGRMQVAVAVVLYSTAVTATVVMADVDPTIVCPALTLHFTEYVFHSFLPLIHPAIYTIPYNLPYTHCTIHSRTKPYRVLLINLNVIIT